MLLLRILCALSIHCLHPSGELVGLAADEHGHVAQLGHQGDGDLPAGERDAVHKVIDVAVEVEGLLSGQRAVEPRHNAGIDILVAVGEHDHLIVIVRPFRAGF